MLKGRFPTSLSRVNLQRRGLASSAWSKYSALLETHPLLTKAVTSGLICGAGDTSCQVLASMAPGNREKEPFDVARTARFTLVGSLLLAPTLHVWYGKLNAWVPGSSISSVLKVRFLPRSIKTKPMPRALLSTAWHINSFFGCSCSLYGCREWLSTSLASPHFSSHALCRGTSNCLRSFSRSSNVLLLDYTANSEPPLLAIPSLLIHSLLILEGKASDIGSRLKASWADAVVANWGLWVPAQLINFRFVPPIYQVPSGRSLLDAPISGAVELPSRCQFSTALLTR
jgi:hypothetical protein